MSISTELKQELAGHPVFIAALGLSPLLARSETLITAAGMGFAFVCVLFSSTLVVGVIRHFIPWSFRLIFILLITATSVTVVDRLMQAWLFELHAAHGMYIPLIAVNTLLMAIMEETVLRHTPAKTMITVAATGIVVFLVVTAVGLIRELLGRGGLLTDASGLLPGITAPGIVIGGDGLPLMTTAAGAFLVLGCLIAAVRALVSERPSRQQ